MRKIGLIAAFVLFVVLQTNAQDIFVTSFEENTLGNINNQNLWDVESGIAKVTELTPFVNSGTKGLNFLAQSQTLVVSNTTFGGSAAGIGGIVYVDLFVKINSMATKDFAISGYDLFGGSGKRTFVFEFDTPSGSSGMFMIYNGSSKVDVKTYNLGEWNRISARIDYTNDVYQVIFNGSEAVSVNFRENYTPEASGNRQANIKEYHETRFNLGYDSATGSVDAAIDDISVSTIPIPDINFPVAEVTHIIDIEQPEIGSISIDPEMEEYTDSLEVTVTLTLPEGYKNEGWTGSLSGTELEKTFMVTGNMQISANVGIDLNNPPALYTVSITRPDTGEISLSPEGGIYYNYTKVTASLNLPAGYINAGWTGDLSGTSLKETFVVNGNMQIGADVKIDTTPPAVYTVSSGSELKNICKGKNLKAGDIVEVSDGVYDSGGITVESEGTLNKPIIIRAKNIGGAELSGSSYFNFRKAAYIVLEGFKFTSDAYTVVKMEACNNIRLTKNIFQLKENEGESGKWVYIGGYWDDGSLLSHHNRIDHNIFRDKTQLGNFITIDGGEIVSQHDRIDNNYFYNIGPRHENEMEAIRVGWSELSLTDGFTVIEHNLFEECDGDPEIISIKSCKDTVRYNTILRSQGTVSLRHGDGSEVYGNYFLGDGKSGTGGVRIYGRRHKIYNNYFEGLTGYRWDAAITLTNGDTDSGSVSSHWRINDLLVCNNTLVNNYSNIEIGYAKDDNSWKKEPKNVTIANNLIEGNKADLVKIINPATNLIWDNNIMYPKDGFGLGLEAAENQIKVVNPELEYKEGLWLISSASPAIDAVSGNYININEDIQGQERAGINDIGADEYSTSSATRFPLNPENVGPNSVTAVLAEEEMKVPDAFILFRNYPNPFNPATTLEYVLEKNSNVKLGIFNILGQRVALLNDNHQAAGTHSLQWKAVNISSGIYFAVLKTDNSNRTIKLFLMK
ncbi:MAG: T9SS type A sorting domain-containing protein [Melioribacteraceae bacterium]|nr:T9SS type A sorting domain-containing protein [Melioribacteraceae bacterium]